MNNGVRLGLIGAGRWGRNYIKTIRNLEGIGLTYLASRNPKARQWVDEDCKITKKWKEVADVDNIDGVIIVTPPRLHAEMTRFFLDVGLPVLVEKPLTMNLGEAETLLEFAENKGSIVLVDHTQLFNPAWKSFKDYASGMGKVLKIESIAGNWGPFRRETPVLWDWGPHGSMFGYF